MEAMIVIGRLPSLLDESGEGYETREIIFPADAIVSAIEWETEGGDETSVFKLLVDGIVVETLTGASGIAEVNIQVLDGQLAGFATVSQLGLVIKLRLQLKRGLHAEAS